MNSKKVAMMYLKNAPARPKRKEGGEIGQSN